jgi:peptide/nickel transport system permease protein
MGRRVLSTLHRGDAATFVALATSLALGTRRALSGTHMRARVALALDLPIGSGVRADALALALVLGSLVVAAHGTRVDLQMGLIGVILPFLLGTVVGALSGYFGRFIDIVLMRILDVMLSFPWLVLLIAIITVLRPGLGSFYVAITLVGWVSYARLVRAQTLVLKNSDFVHAAVSLGYGHLRILFRHILPNALVPSIVFSMSDVVLVILAGSSISYLGLGVQPPTAEWGVMIAEGQNFIVTAWWITAFPGLSIVFLAFGFSLLADGLGEKLGVRE